MKKSGYQGDPGFSMHVAQPKSTPMKSEAVVTVQEAAGLVLVSAGREHARSSLHPENNWPTRIIIDKKDSFLFKRRLSWFLVCTLGRGR